VRTAKPATRIARSASRLENRVLLKSDSRKRSYLSVDLQFKEEEQKKPERQPVFPYRPIPQGFFQ